MTDKVKHPNHYTQGGIECIEAIKEFAKRCIDKSKNGVIYQADIPDYVKEMIGETNEQIIKRDTRKRC